MYYLFGFTVEYFSTGPCWSTPNRVTRVDDVTASHSQMEKDLKRNRFNVRYLISSSIINFGVNCGILPWLDSVNKTATDEFPVTK